MVELTDIQKKIRASLITAINNKNPQNVQNIFNSNEKVTNFLEVQPYFANTIDDLQRFQGKIDSNNTDIYSALETVIQEMEEHKRVMDLDYNLKEAIISLNVTQVKAALINIM